MDTCPDCTYVEEQIKDDSRYEIIDIGRHVRNLKEFLKLRDSSLPLPKQNERKLRAFHALYLKTEGLRSFLKMQDSNRARRLTGAHASWTEAGADKKLKTETGGGRAPANSRGGACSHHDGGCQNCHSSRLRYPELVRNASNPPCSSVILTSMKGTFACEKTSVASA